MASCGFDRPIKGLRLILSLAAVMLLWPGLSHAAWVRVETDRFVIYGRGGERDVRDYATKLTTFDTVLRRFHALPNDAPVSQKLEVYLVGDDLRVVAPKLSNDVLGFYRPGPDGVIAVVEHRGVGALGDNVLFHEYAHHFMLENFPAAYPAWFVEGWAEYFATVEISPEIIKVGGYNPARVAGLFNQQWLSMNDLLTKRSGQITGVRRYVYYPQAWLFTHYMRSDRTRAVQMDTAIRDISKGVEPVAAFQKATGQDAEALYNALKKYRELRIYRMPNPIKAPPPMTVTVLPKSADDLLLASLRMSGGPGAGDAAFLKSLRSTAARYPGDQFAELTLARAEFLYGDVEKGDAIIKRRLEANPNEVEALRVGGHGQLVAGRRDGEDLALRFREGRKLLLRAYQLEKDDYRILFDYIISRSVEPVFPTDNDLNVLIEARAMAPSVEEISFATGSALLKRGRKEEAKNVLAALANNPHGGQLAARARALIEGKSEAEAEQEPEDPVPAPSAPSAGPERKPAEPVAKPAVEP